MTRIDGSTHIQLTYGRRPKRLHHYPACGGHGLRKAGPFYLAAFEAIHFIGSPPGSTGLIGPRGWLEGVASGGLHYGAFDDHTSSHILPQGDQELASKRDDCRLFVPPTVVLHTSLEPTCEGRVRLIADPKP